MCSLRNRRLGLLASIGLSSPSSPRRRPRRLVRPGRRAAARPRRRATGASIPRPTSPASRPRPPTTCCVQVPGFTIRSADQERGLGQASENVLINGQRIANKSGGAIDELQKVSAAQCRADRDRRGRAARHRRPVGTGRQRHRQGGRQGQRAVRMGARNPRPLCQAQAARGLGQLLGQDGPGRLYACRSRTTAGRGAFGGPIRLYDANGVNFENRDEILHNEFELVTLSGKFKLDGPGSSVGNLTLVLHALLGARAFARTAASALDGDDRDRVTETELDGWYYDINGDYEFALGPGRLKLIGLRHFDHEPVVTTQVTRFDSGADDEGIRFSRDFAHRRDRRPRRIWLEDRQERLAGLARAGVQLARPARRAVRARPDGEFVEVPFPEGSGKVEEVRYEAIGTLQPPADPEARPAGRRRRRDFRARARRRRPAGAQILPPQGQRLARLAAGQGLGRQPQAAPPRRADQLLRFPRPAQPQPGPRE